MSKFSFKKLTALVMAVVLILSVTAVGSFAEQKAAPLFTITDIDTNQGEQFDVTIKFAQDVSPSKINIAALDVSLKYNTSVYTVVNVAKGAGLEAALDKLSGGSTLHLETGNYIFGSSTKEAGFVNWSLSTIDGFTFQKDSAFAVVTFKANDISSLEGELDMTLSVTNAATKTFDDTTALYTDVKNNAKVAVNLAKLCQWELNSDGTAYTLVKLNDTNATKFTIPDEYKAESDESALPVTKVRVGAFADCTKIQEVVFGENIKTIDSGAFFDNATLKKVSFFNDDVKIGKDAFYGSMKALTVKCRKGSTAETFAKDNKLTIEYFGDVEALSCKGLDEEVFYNNGKPVKLSKLEFTDPQGNKLVEGKDYTLTYENNTKVGTATIHMTGKGEYNGTRDFTFEIECPYHVIGSEYYSEVKVYEDCSKGGYVDKYCALCGYHNTEEKLPAKEHVKDEEVVIKEATCKEAGKKVCTCKDCNAKYDETTITRLDHEYDWVVTTPATCEEEGVERYQCKHCGDLGNGIVKTRAISCGTHEHKYVVTKEATCTEDGLEVEMCPLCGEKTGILRVIPSKGGHKVGSEWTVIEESTCTKAGKEALLCTECGEVVATRDLPLAEHTASARKIIVTPPTCEKEGYIEYFCDVCGKSMGTKPTEAALGHEWSEKCIIKEATCTEAGKEGCVCAICGAEKDVTAISAKGHSYSKEAVVIKEATCTENGIKGVVCENCGQIKEGTKEIIAAKGSHSYGEWEVVKAPTCLEEGYKQRTCSDCGEVQIETIKATGHKKVFVASTLPTYKHTGIEKAVCEHCGYEYGETRVCAKVYPDTNGDGNITAVDALAILQHTTDLIPLKEDALKNADCNGDKKVNSSDALIVLQISAGIITL